MNAEQYQNTDQLLETIKYHKALNEEMSKMLLRSYEMRVNPPIVIAGDDKTYAIFAEKHFKSLFFDKPLWRRIIIAIRGRIL